MVNFTQAAFQKLESSLDPTDVLRIRAIAGACSGVFYSMEIEDEPDNNDVIIDQHSFKVCVDPYSKYLLKDLNIDYVKTESGSGFKFGDSRDTADPKDCDCTNAEVC